MKNMSDVLVQVGYIRGAEPLANNQNIIVAEDGVVFANYESIIAVKMRDGKVYLNEQKYAYSSTTTKWLYRALNLDKKLITAGLKSGNIELVKDDLGV